MKYILDSNIALKWLLEEELSDKARQAVRFLTPAPRPG